MKIFSLIGISLIFFGCSSTSKTTFEEKYSMHLKAGITPIELLREPFVLRIWMDGNGSYSRMLSVYSDSTSNTAVLTKHGYSVKRKFLKKKYEFVPYYENIRMHPIIGWEMFLTKLDSVNLESFADRPLNIATDGVRPGLSRILVELKQEDSISRFLFWSNYPYLKNPYPADMAKYFKFESFILSSFQPLYDQWKYEEENYYIGG